MCIVHCRVTTKKGEISVIDLLTEERKWNNVKYLIKNREMRKSFKKRSKEQLWCIENS